MITEHYFANGKNLKRRDIDTTYVYSLYIALMMLRCSDETLAN